MQAEKPVRRGVYILPNLFTTASLFTGFLAMILATRGSVEGAALAILFSALMDGLDGKVAVLPIRPVNSAFSTTRWPISLPSAWRPRLHAGHGC